MGPPYLVLLAEWTSQQLQWTGAVESSVIRPVTGRKGEHVFGAVVSSGADGGAGPRACGGGGGAVGPDPPVARRADPRQAPRRPRAPGPTTRTGPAGPAEPGQAYDQHLNMILGDVEETITQVEIDDETYEAMTKVRPPVGPASRPGRRSNGKWTCCLCGATG